MEPVANNHLEGSHLRISELLVKQDPLYMLGRVEETELEWLIDTGCSLNLISKDVFEMILQENRPIAEHVEILDVVFSKSKPKKQARGGVPCEKPCRNFC